MRRPLCLLVVQVIAAGLVAVPWPDRAASAAGPTIAAAGDIGCPRRPCRAQRATTRIVRELKPEAVLPLGDSQYNHGSRRAYRRSYRPTWGEFRSITHPVPGNHDYETRRARGYFRFFGAAAHGPGGYYSYDLGRWHLVALNSEVRSRAQARWLREDLRRDGHTCELAYWHQPRFSSGFVHGGTRTVAGLWRILYRAGADVVLNGHEHSYERFARLSPGGRKRADGIREFVAGTGGYDLYGFGRRHHASQRRLTSHGVLAMGLEPSSYSWRFIKTIGGVGDRGRTDCHV